MVQKERNAPGFGPCAVCGTRDSRALVMVDLKSGLRVTLCGSHELMHRRSGERSRTVDELRITFVERRRSDRRGARRHDDELAERLQAAFTVERRGVHRRAC
jgi:hypothetical protein